MGLRILGPLELVVDGESPKLGGPKERIVLAALALKANRVTSIDHLVDAVWATAPPSSARIQIQKCVSLLRKLFGDFLQPGAIKTYPPGYLLEIAADQLDSEEFSGLVTAARRHVTEGRAEEGATALRAGLALWRGRALDGVPSEIVQRGAAVLESARLAAIEELMRLDLDMGHHQEICGELMELVDEHPLRERLYGFLMLALYRSGRQAEALEACRRARTTLINEVGVEPGHELQSLERAILNRDPALDLRPTVVAHSVPVERGEPHTVAPRQLPGSTADFVGREDQITEITRFLTGADDTHTAAHAVRVVAVSGRGGVGKSTLAVRVAHEVGDAFPDGHLHADLAGPNGDDRTATLLARFLRALGVAGSAVPEDRQERIELYRTTLSDKRLLVVLDGVTREEQVLPLLPGTSTCAVIVTSRVRLTGLPGARHIDVDVFDPEKSVELLAKLAGPTRVRAEAAQARELVRLCGGLPLAIRIAGGRLASRPQWRIAGLVRRLANEAVRLDEFSHRGLELRTSIGLTYRSLCAEAQRLFRLFALVPAPDFPAWAAAAALDTDPMAAADTLDQLVEARVLDIVEYFGGRVRYRFHDLIQIYAIERLAETETVAERNAALGRLLGAWLALADRAHRSEYGGDFTVLHGNAPRWSKVDLLDEDPADEPVEWWENERRAVVAAIRKSAAEGLDELCWDLALAAMSLFEVRGYFDDWRETAELALHATERAGNRTGQAAMLYSLGTLHMSQKRLPEAEGCFASALEKFEAEGDTRGCALVLRNGASVDRMLGRFTSMLAKYEESLVKMREIGDPVGEASVLRSIARFRTEEGEVEQALALLDDALALCRQVNYRRGAALVLSAFGELHLATGKLALARQHYHQVLRIVRDLGDRIGEAHALYGLGLIRRQESKLDNAETTLVNALSLAQQVGERLIEAKVCYALGDIELARGNSAVASEHLHEARALFDELGSALWIAKTLILLAEVCEGDGDMALADRVLNDALELLSGLESKEAARLKEQVTELRTAPLVEEFDERRKSWVTS
jgi:DNA-binding SARP family transcriptional activator/tetratricopeptide (TPR) repeat protein